MIKNGDSIAVVNGDIELSYKDIDRQSNSFANGLLKAGFKCGDKIVLQLPNYHEFIIDFLRNKIWYNSSMNYEASKQLTDVRFKRLVGVQRTTFEEMLAVLKTAYQRKHAKGGRTPKLSLEDLLMATLQYMREYRTYEQIAADFGIHESNLIRRSQWVESTLIQSGFTISKTHLSAEDTVIVDATEVKINRPKKIN
ncbi:hypothetical protein SAG0304_06855 [Streptococcus agalactiae GB00018]|nr:hypothetical protein SAG0304_06855 [Streptococcus agalactiae GB00018]